MPYLENTSAFIRTHHEPLESRVLLAAEAICNAASDLQPFALESSLRASGDNESISTIHEMFGIDGYGQTVAIIDSGIAYDHQALGGGLGTGYRVVGGWDFAENDPIPYDDAPAGYHGTHVSGIVGSSDARSLGIAPRVDMVGLRIFSDQGYSQIEWLEDALAWVHDNKDSFEFPITTVNLSVGFVDDISDATWSRINAKLSQLSADGIFVAAAAGNEFHVDSPDKLSLAGSSEHVFPVASIDSDGQLSQFSQRHDRVLAAPGEGILSTAPDYIEDFNGITDDFQSLTGTSMAAPFVAGASILVRQAMEKAGYADIDQHVIYDHLRKTADDVIDTVTGKTFKAVNLYNAVSSIASSPTPDPDPANSIDLGIADFIQLESQDLSNESTYSVVAANDGILTVMVDGQGISSTGIRIFDEDRNALPIYSETGTRIDVLVEKDVSYSIQINSNLQDANVRIANLVSPDSDRLRIVGTAKNDSTKVTMDDDVAVEINGVNYTFASTLRYIEFDGLAGEDKLNVNDSYAHSVRLSSTNTNFASKIAQVSATDFEEIIIATENANATARIVGDRLAETITIDSNAIEIRSAQFEGQLVGFSKVSISGSGGRDHVRYFDSVFDDRVVVTSESIAIENQLMSATILGVGKLSAFAAAAGDDSIEIFDSPSDDRLFVSPNVLQFQGDGLQVLGSRFERTVTHSQYGGRDQARIFGSDFNDVFVASPVAATMVGNGYENSAFGFHSVMAYARTGNDRAELQDSPGNDKVVMKSSWTRLRGAGYTNYVSQFDTVVVDAGEGVDQAFMHDSARDDDFYATPMFARMSGEAFYNLAKGFERVYAYASLGEDRASLFDSLANDQLVTEESKSWLTGSDFWNQVEGFDELDVRGGRGWDVAEIRDLASDGVDYVAQKRVEIRRQNSIESIWGFDDISGITDVEKLL